MNMRQLSVLLVLLLVGFSLSSCSDKKTSKKKNSGDNELLSDIEGSSERDKEKDTKVEKHLPPIKPLPRPEVDMASRKDQALRDYIKVAHRGKLMDLLKTLVNIRHFYVLAKKDPPPKRPWLFYGIERFKPKVNVLPVFTSRQYVNHYLKKHTKDSSKWMVIDFDANTAVDTMVASRRYFITRQGKRYNVRAIWMNPEAPGKWETRIPLKVLAGNSKAFKKKFKEKFGKLYFIYRNKPLVGNNKPEPLMGFDPDPPTRPVLTVPAYTQEKYAKYHWSLMGEKARQYKVVSIKSADLIEELFKMRRISKKIKGKRRRLAGVIVNPKFKPLEHHIPITALLKLYVINKKKGAKK